MYFLLSSKFYISDLLFCVVLFRANRWRRQNVNSQNWEHEGGGGCCCCHAPRLLRLSHNYKTNFVKNRSKITIVFESHLGQPYNFLLNLNVLDGYSSNYCALVVINSYYIIAWWRFRIPKHLNNFWTIFFEICHSFLYGSPWQKLAEQRNAERNFQIKSAAKNYTFQVRSS